MAEVALQSGQFAEAEGLFRKAVQLRPDNAGVEAAWGRFLEQNSRWKEAEAAYRRSLNLEPDAVNIRVSLGDVLLKGLNDPSAAAQAYRNAIKVDPSHGGAHFALAATLSRQGKTAEARTELEEAARLSPGNPLPHQALGELFVSQNDIDAALKAFGAALKANPGFFLARLSRGDIFMNRGEHAQALQEFDAAAAIVPKSPLPKVKAGMAYQAARKTNEARERYLVAIELDAKQTLALNNLAWMAAESGSDLDRALGWAKQAVSLAPKDANVLDTLGWVQYRRGDLAGAVSSLQRAAQIDSKQPGPLYHLGVVYEQMGRRTEAETALRRALSLTRSFDGAADAERRLASYQRR